MNIIETTNALALAQAYDNRTVGEANVRAWYLVLGDLAADDVMEAIRRHYLTETAWVMPAHINRLVGEIGQEREKAARKWAPGQHGVPLEQALPELPRGERLTAGDVSPRVLELLSQLRAVLPEAPREKLFPRQEAWKREQAAFQRADTAAPNPHYRPGGPVDDLLADAPAPTAVRGGIQYGGGEQPSVVEQARDLCRANGPHDSGLHIEICPDSNPAPIAARCTVCGADSEDIVQHQRDYPGGSCE